MINRETIETIKRQEPDFLPLARQPVNGRASYICPICGHGGGGDGVAYNPHKPGNWKCFGCGKSFDVIDLWQAANNEPDFTKAMLSLADHYGVEIEQDPQGDQKSPPRDQEAKTETAAGGPNPQPPSPLMDYSKELGEFNDYLMKSEAAQPGRDYLASRGISLKMAMIHNLGMHKDKTGVWRITFPAANNYGYMGRDITGRADPKCRDIGKKTGFNLEALYHPGPVFITEGAFDALSLEELGFNAFALCGSHLTGDMLEELRKNSPKASPLIVALDNDVTGETGAAAVVESLKGLGLDAFQAKLYGKYNDANERLIADREGLDKAAQDCIAGIARPYSTLAYIETAMGADMEKIKDCMPTGFRSLDRLLGGAGLFPGLYVLAAVTSLGKTTFALQLADQVAAGGNDALFFSLEQSRLELVSKSLARFSGGAALYRDIMRGSAPNTTRMAASAYKAAVRDHVGIIEGNFSMSTKTIRQEIANHINRTGKRPFVVVDYLQVLKPQESRAKSAKESVDAIITELKQTSRDLSVPVLAISSINRGAYLEPVDFSSLKESGAIEFGADVVLTLNLAVVLEDSFDQKKPPQKRKLINEAKAAPQRAITLTCLKNRMGAINPDGLAFTYWPARELYQEPGQIIEEVGNDGEGAF